MEPDKAATVPPGWVVSQAPFSSAGELQMYWVSVPNDMTMDMRVGIVLSRRGRSILIPSEEFPVLSDLLAGIVRRSKLT